MLQVGPFDHGQKVLRSLPVKTDLAIIFFVAEGRLPSCQSTPFARRVRANRQLPVRMRSLWTGPLLPPRAVWRRPLSVGTCPPVMTYKANTGRTRPFRKMRTRFYEFQAHSLFSWLMERRTGRQAAALVSWSSRRPALRQVPACGRGAYDGSEIHRQYMSR